MNLFMNHSRVKCAIQAIKEIKEKQVDISTECYLNSVEHTLEQIKEDFEKEMEEY